MLQEILTKVNLGEVSPLSSHFDNTLSPPYIISTYCLSTVCGIDLGPFPLLSLSLISFLCPTHLKLIKIVSCHHILWGKNNNKIKHFTWNHHIFVLPCFVAEKDNGKKISS